MITGTKINPERFSLIISKKENAEGKVGYILCNEIKKVIAKGTADPGVAEKLWGLYNPIITYREEAL